MNSYRKEIDRIDAQLVRLYEERMEVSLKIGTYKASKGMPVFDAQREEEKIESVRAMASTPFLADGAERMFRLLMELSRKAQDQLRGNEPIHSSSEADCECPLNPIHSSGKADCECPLNQ